jgi:hypothetical protein
MEPIQLFRLLFDDQFKALIIDQSVRYARQSTRISTSPARSWRRATTSCRDRRSRSKDIDCPVDIVSKAMTRNRFIGIKNNLHFADNEALEANNKMAKIEPLYNEVNRALLKFGCWAESLSIYEE